jgi:hypothetical protein
MAYLDEGLATLSAQWKAEHPGAVVYWIADGNHSSTSEHSPEKAGSAPGADAGEVDAIDLMPGKGGVTMADLRELRDNLVRERDPRFLYAIIDDRIVSSVVSPWTLRKYNGKRHGHLHVSVNDKFDANRTPWEIGDEPVRQYTNRPIEGVLPELRVGDEDQPGKTEYVKRAQRLLKVDDDGVYGPATAAALKKRMAGQSGYKPSSTNGGKLYIPEWRVLYGIW